MKDDLSSLVRFAELIPGTVSDAEIALQKQASEVDNLVDFGDLVPLNDSPRTIPITQSLKRETPVIDSNNSVVLNLPLVLPLPRKENELLDADKYKENAFDSISREMNLVSSVKNNSGTGNISRTNSPISYKSDTFFSANSASRSESPQLAGVPTAPAAATSTDVNASTAVTVPTADNVPTAAATHTAAATPNPPASNSEPFEEKEGSSSETEKKAMKPVRLRVKRSDDSYINLSLHDVSF